MYGWTTWNYEQYIWDGLAGEVGGPEKKGRWHAASRKTAGEETEKPSTTSA
jgi:hypothetical protein